MANSKLIIKTPRTTSHTQTSPNGTMSATLKWDPRFGPKKTEAFQKAQIFIDSEVLRFCSSRVPFDTGMLQKSGILGTTTGSGLVQYIAPYAAKQYYHTRETRSYDANRGAKWFERGKAVERERILRGANKIAGGGLR